MVVVRLKLIVLGLLITFVRVDSYLTPSRDFGQCGVKVTDFDSVAKQIFNWFIDYIYYLQHDKCPPENSKCYKPKEKPDYLSNNELAIYLPCCAGFKKDEKGNCVPVCDPPCGNGTCVDVNVCKCKNGYDSKNACKPICSKPCKNGQCLSPEKCSCNEGYYLDPNNPYMCLPECNSCSNGNCTSKYKCECNDGFIIDPDHKYKCIPYCSQTCINGKCTSTETCTCSEGYLKTYDPYLCKPFCKYPCVNSKCVAPNTCQCNQGFQANDAHVCVPKCKYPCIQGFCIGGKCQCYPGYEMISGNPYYCSAIEKKSTVYRLQLNQHNMMIISIMLLIAGFIVILILVFVKKTYSYSIPYLSGINENLYASSLDDFIGHLAKPDNMSDKDEEKGFADTKLPDLERSSTRSIEKSEHAENIYFNDPHLYDYL